MPISQRPNAENMGNSIRASANGKLLKKDIDDIYTQLRRNRSLKQSIWGGNDISDAVSRHISPGTPFVDAENILRSAGFELMPGWPNAANKVYSVRASIVKYKPLLLGRVGVDVTISSKDDRTRDVVYITKGSIYSVTL
jgi:hypothetical protein